MVEDHGRGRHLVRSRIWPRDAPASSGRWRRVRVSARGGGHRRDGGRGCSARSCRSVAFAVGECSMATATALAALERAPAPEVRRPGTARSGTCAGCGTLGEEADEASRAARPSPWSVLPTSGGSFPTCGRTAGWRRARRPGRIRLADDPAGAVAAGDHIDSALGDRPCRRAVSLDGLGKYQLLALRCSPGGITGLRARPCGD